MRLFNDNPVAERQLRTDRLFLERYVREFATNKQLDQEIPAAFEVIKKWAELESSGRLSKLKETQLQGDFLGEIFGHALGYQRPVDNDTEWQLVQHQSFRQQTPDAVLGKFRPGKASKPLAVIELKGSKVHLDRDRSNGRTAVDQCWDYLVNMPRECRWGIVSNMVSFRLYERDSTKRKYQHFSLQQLTDIDEFRKFYAIFHRRGLIESTAGTPPRAVQLLDKTTNRQRAVGDELYEQYSRQRIQLIEHLHKDLHHPVVDAIEMAQRLFDRVIFIAFCEDRDLLPDETIKKAYGSVPGFSSVPNPRWQNFKSLFRFVDLGSDDHGIPAYNGGLFAHHPVDDLELDDAPITNFFNSLGGYDFADEVNLDVLGHLFEQSITELEKIRESALFGGNADKTREFAEMPQSAKRKRLGTYYTPTELTSRIVQYTVDELIQQRLADLATRHGIDPDEAKRGALPESQDFWRSALDLLRDIKVIDPACGSGAFLFQAYDALELRYGEIIEHLGDKALINEVPRFILNDNLFGVDLSAEAVEITQLALWIRSASKEHQLSVLSRNIVQGNSLVSDPSVDSDAFDWKERFPEVFDREGYDGNGGGFDCVIGNPPWERMKLQEREFFAVSAPQIATASNAATRRKFIAKLESSDPVLHAQYTLEKERASTILEYCRKSKRYPLTGKGDINTYAIFAELASLIVAPSGRAGLLIPSGIASDKTTRAFFGTIAESGRLLRLFDFENKKTFFPDVHGAFKFCIFNFLGEGQHVDEAEFVFFAHKSEEIDDSSRRIRLSGEDIALLNPNTKTCPIFRSRRDAEITKAIYKRVPVLLDLSREKTGNPWGIRFERMFDQTNDAELFEAADSLSSKRYKLDGNVFAKGNKRYLPVYEAKMVQMYDHRAASVVLDESNWVRQGQTSQTTLVQHQNPEYAVQPRYWVDEKKVSLPDHGVWGFKDITSPTNQRTMIASYAPRAGYTNHFVLAHSTAPIPVQLCLLANFNSFVFDYCTRQKIGGITLNFFIVEQLPCLTPQHFDVTCTWKKDEQLSEWIASRVLMLTCTNEEMIRLAESCDFRAGSINEYEGRLHKWIPSERAELMAELDAAFFLLYGIDREDAEYILSTFAAAKESQSLLHGRTMQEMILDRYDWFSAQSMAQR